MTVDFSFTEEQEDLRALARRILDAEATPERVKEAEAGGERIDRTRWALADAGLVGVSLPEDVGGGGYGLTELAVVLEEVGRHVAPVPLLASVIAGRALARGGAADALAGVADGTSIVTFALHGSATASGDRLSGEKLSVPYGMAADRIVVTADDGLYVVDADGAGVTREPAEATNRERQAGLRLDGAPARRLGGAEAVEQLWDEVRLALCALQVGVLDAAVRITAGYISEREQFGKPLATFQGATLKAADAYIDVQALSVTTWSAIWRHDDGRPSRDETAIAAFWAAEAGHRVAYACQHLHGGMGVDVDYPIHRYFLWAKAVEFQLGGAVPQLLEVTV